MEWLTDQLAAPAYDILEPHELDQLVENLEPLAAVLVAAGSQSVDVSSHGGPVEDVSGSGFGVLRESQGHSPPRTSVVTLPLCAYKEGGRALLSSPRR